MTTLATESPIKLNVDKQEFFESGTVYSRQYVIGNTLLPDDPNNSRVIYLLGPARGGTTAMIMHLTSNQDVTSGFFQPHKNGFRHGGQIDLRSAGNVIAMKDTTGPKYNYELFDPIEMLIAAGLPAENITFVPTLRNPESQFKSLSRFTPGMDPNYFADMQAHTLNLIEQYTQTAVKVVPFAFDLLRTEHADTALAGFYEALGLHYHGRQFNDHLIDQKMIWGEADRTAGEAQANYYEMVVRNTRAFGGLGHHNGTMNKVLTEEADASIIRQAVDLTLSDYQDYLHSTAKFYDIQL